MPSFDNPFWALVLLILAVKAFCGENRNNKS